MICIEAPPSIHRNLVYQIPPRIEGQDVLDSQKGLFCAPTPFALDSDKEGFFIGLRLNSSSLLCDAQEARKKQDLSKGRQLELGIKHGVNDHNVMQVLSAIPKLREKMQGNTRLKNFTLGGLWQNSTVFSFSKSEDMELA